ncbi:response regulator transcription factor [Sediminibacterium sp. TEGAF015]|uniref:response regulator transcription factor n=1 Tax=Sediminibacterium sp. TEGAF015 TaxID=575378 RepID=UPI0021FCAB09|nr:response regulator transcription factor [Sediminibacterium sp. TEGAF015]BDQ12830.1 DNA-binding response regulator [Sediminibacterium sp. TEGAF015]
MHNRIKIAIADDHKIFAEGIRSVLKEQEWINWVGEAFNTRDAIQLYIDRRPDIYLLDYHFPDGTGYQVAEKILSQFPEAKIILLSMENDNDIMLECKALGVRGYIIKNLSSDELIEAIETVLHNQSFFMWGEEEAALMKDAEGGLSKREKEIVSLITKGFTSQEIADAINLSVLTINTHRRNILRKLNLKNTAMMVQYARINKW